MKECRSLVRAGYTVFLIAPAEAPQIIDGVNIVPFSRTRNRFERFTKTTWGLYKKARKIDADIYHFHDPEIMVVGWLLKLRGKRIIYDVHEDLPRQVRTKDWIPSLLRPLVAGLVELAETITARLIDGIVAATPTIAARFPDGKVELVQNFPILEETVLAGMAYKDRPAIISFLGVMGQIRGTEELVKAMKFVSPELRAELHLTGQFYPENFRSRLSSLPGWKSVVARDWVPRSEVLTELGLSRIGVVTYHPVANYVKAQPIKLFEYMANGIPVVVSDFPLWKELVEREGCGLTVNPLDPRAVATAIEWLLRNPDKAQKMGEKGRSAVSKTYNWAPEARKLTNFYEKIARAEKRQASTRLNPQPT